MSVETSVFGAEFVTMKQVKDALRGLGCKLRMLVVHNTSRLGSVFKKKSSSVCYYAMHKSVAMGESLVGHYLAKRILMMKVLYGQKRRYLAVNILYNFHYNH